MNQSGEKNTPEPAPVTLAGREERSYTFQFLTPMFGGGVDPKATKGDPISKIRGASIRGQLRLWWRATQGPRFKTIKEMHAEETRIFGGAVTGGQEESASRGVVIRLDVSRLTVTSSKDAADVEYFSFPLREERSTRLTAKLQGDLHLHLRFPADASPGTIQQVEAAVWAFACFGGIGGRTRRGFGALRLVDGELDGLCPAPDSGYLDSRYIVQEGDGPPPRVPVLSRRHGAEFRSFPKNNARDAWKWLDCKLSGFRQGSIGRNPPASGSRHPGRSRWPEADLIRHELAARYQGDAKHHDRLIHLSRAPRAAFGMPIIFHFKAEPIGDVTLKPRNAERYASPLILRPMGQGDKAWASVLVLGNRSDLDELDIVMEQKGGQERSVKTRLTGAEARWDNSPLEGRSSDPLLAFLAFCTERG